MVNERKHRTPYQLMFLMVLYMVFNGESQCHLWIGNHFLSTKQTRNFYYAPSMASNPKYGTNFLDYIPKNHTDILDYKK